jgi:hypothetical protein
MKKSFILDASRESLLVYWLHLITIFGAFWDGKSLAIIIGAKLNALEVVGVTIVLISLMIIMAKLWGWIRKTYPKQISIGVKVFVGALVLVFFIS